MPLVVVNLEAQRNQLRLLYEDAGTPLEEELKNGNKLPLAQATKPPPPREPSPSFHTFACWASLPCRQARDVLRQILRALAYCHCQGITHRNLKPKYVLLKRKSDGEGKRREVGFAGSGDDSVKGRWSVKLSDFNSVRWLGIHATGGDEQLYGATQARAHRCGPMIAALGNLRLPLLCAGGRCVLPDGRDAAVSRTRNPSRLHFVYDCDRHVGLRLRLR